MAAAVLALAITTSITTMQRAYASLDTARNLSLAGQIMQNELEQMRMCDWSTVNAYPAGPTTLTIDSSFTTGTNVASRFTLVRETSLVHAGMKQVKLTVSWRSYDGRTLSRSYTTRYGQNGLYDFFYNSS